jgi:hypothetical protein
MWMKRTITWVALPASARVAPRTGQGPVTSNSRRHAVPVLVVLLIAAALSVAVADSGNVGGVAALRGASSPHRPAIDFFPSPVDAIEVATLDECRDAAPAPVPRLAASASCGPPLLMGIRPAGPSQTRAAAGGRPRDLFERGPPFRMAGRAEVPTVSAAMADVDIE